MKIYTTTLDGLKKIVEAIKKGNPPDGMTRQEWYHEIGQAFDDCQKEISSKYDVHLWRKYDAT